MAEEEYQDCIWSRLREEAPAAAKCEEDVGGNPKLIGSWPPPLDIDVGTSGQPKSGVERPQATKKCDLGSHDSSGLERKLP